MIVTIETLSAHIRQARAQQEQHKANMNAADGAAQAYEQLLTEMIQAQRQSTLSHDKAAFDEKAIEILKDDIN